MKGAKWGWNNHERVCGYQAVHLPLQDSLLLKVQSCAVLLEQSIMESKYIGSCLLWLLEAA